MENIRVGIEFNCNYNGVEWRGVVLSDSMKEANGDTILIKKLTGDDPREFTTEKSWFNSKRIKINYIDSPLN